MAKNASEARPRIPTSTITPTTIRIAFNAPPPEDGAGVATGGVEGVGGAEPTAGGDARGGSVDVSTAAPHLLQKRVPATILAPQELQNAIRHLQKCRLRTVGAVYRRLAGKRDRLDGRSCSSNVLAGPAFIYLVKGLGR